jgi:hypothetical protein
MRPFAIACAVLAVAALPARADHGRKNLAETIPAAGATAIAIDFPVGDLRVETGTTDEVRVDLKVTCDRWFRSCADRIDDVRLVSSRKGERLSVEILGWEHGHSGGDLEVTGTITVPADRDLEIDMGVGELDVAVVSHQLDVDLGVGDVDVRMPAAAVKSVSLGAGVGDTSLRLPTGRVAEERSIVSSEIDWRNGSGESKLSVEVGVGDARVILE